MDAQVDTGYYSVVGGTSILYRLLIYISAQIDKEGALALLNVPRCYQLFHGSRMRLCNELGTPDPSHGISVLIWAAFGLHRYTKNQARQYVQSVGVTSYRTRRGPEPPEQARQCSQEASLLLNVVCSCPRLIHCCSLMAIVPQSCISLDCSCISAKKI